MPDFKFKRAGDPRTSMVAAHRDPEGILPDARRDAGGDPTLRIWWHGVLRDLGKFKCYGMFLVLPSDKEAIRYLTECGKELHLISGQSCLVIALSKRTFKGPRFEEETWTTIAGEHSSEGYSLKIARIFEIDMTEFPCLLLFRDIRSPEYLTISLKGMDLNEISARMRVIFTAIQKSIDAGQDPLEGIKQFQVKEKIRNAGRKIAEKTFEAAIEALIEATLKAGTRPITY